MWAMVLPERFPGIRGECSSHLIQFVRWRGVEKGPLAPVLHAVLATWYVPGASTSSRFADLPVEQGIKRRGPDV